MVMMAGLRARENLDVKTSKERGRGNGDGLVSVRRVLDRGQCL